MKVKSGTILRTAALAASVINQVCMALGITAGDEVYEIASAVATVAVSVWCWWKNNSFTQSALIADDYMTLIGGNKIVDDVSDNYD